MGRADAPQYTDAKASVTAATRPLPTGPPAFVGVRVSRECRGPYQCLVELCRCLFCSRRLMAFARAVGELLLMVASIRSDRRSLVPAAGEVGVAVIIAPADRTMVKAARMESRLLRLVVAKVVGTWGCGPSNVTKWQFPIQCRQRLQGFPQHFQGTGNSDDFLMG